jgi:hypothetical protein
MPVLPREEETRAAKVKANHQDLGHLANLHKTDHADAAGSLSV